MHTPCLLHVFLQHLMFSGQSWLLATKGRASFPCLLMVFVLRALLRLGCRLRLQGKEGGQWRKLERRLDFFKVQMRSFSLNLSPSPFRTGHFALLSQGCSDLHLPRGLGPAHAGCVALEGQHRGGCSAGSAARGRKGSPH